MDRGKELRAETMVGWISAEPVSPRKRYFSSGLSSAILKCLSFGDLRLPQTTAH